MARLVLVRHGEAAAGWDADPDPGLSTLGRSQAAVAADTIASMISTPVPVLTSPLQRCQETAAALVARWGSPATIEPRVAEVPTLGAVAFADRGPWLHDLMSGDWPATGELRTWCDDLIDCVVGQPDDAVVFTHFIAINLVLGRIAGDERVVNTSVANCGIAVIESDGVGLQLLQRPGEAASVVW